MVRCFFIISPYTSPVPPPSIINHLSACSAYALLRRKEASPPASPPDGEVFGEMSGEVFAEHLTIRTPLRQRVFRHFGEVLGFLLDNTSRFLNFRDV